MSQPIASKNLYDLLGNDPELDPERATPKEPVKTVDKPTPRAGKRNAPAEAPVRAAGGNVRSTPGNTASGNENAFRDRGVGADKNRSRGSGEPGEHGERSRGELGRGRGTYRGRGRGRAAQGGDRHSRTGHAEHEKQAAHGWGAMEGEAELADEKAGEEIAKADEKEDAAVAVPEEEAEPEDKSVSYAEYLKQQAEKKGALAAQNVRKPNEGSNVKAPEGKPVERTEEEAYFAGSGGKAKRERERKQKEYIELDGAKLRQQETRDSGFRGGRGGRGRGEFRGGEGRGRGGERGGRGRGEARPARGEGRPRGGRGGQAGPNLADASAFPSLGA